MNMTELNSENFAKVVRQDGIVLVYCSAPWCGVCRQFSPLYERVASHCPNHTFTHLDTQAEEELTRELGIEHIPALMLFRDGVLIYCQSGNYTEGTMRDIIEQAESLDMDVIKKEMAAGSSADGRANSGETAPSVP